MKVKGLALLLLLGLVLTGCSKKKTSSNDGLIIDGNPGQSNPVESASNLEQDTLLNISLAVETSTALEASENLRDQNLNITNSQGLTREQISAARTYYFSKIEDLSMPRIGDQLKEKVEKSYHIGQNLCTLITNNIQTITEVKGDRFKLLWQGRYLETKKIKINVAHESENTHEVCDNLYPEIIESSEPLVVFVEERSFEHEKNVRKMQFDNLVNPIFQTYIYDNREIFARDYYVTNIKIVSIRNIEKHGHKGIEVNGLKTIRPMHSALTMTAPFSHTFYYSTILGPESQTSDIEFDRERVFFRSLSLISWDLSRGHNVSRELLSSVPNFDQSSRLIREIQDWNEYRIENHNTYMRNDVENDAEVQSSSDVNAQAEAQIEVENL